MKTTTWYISIFNSCTLKHWLKIVYLTTLSWIPPRCRTCCELMVSGWYDFSNKKVSRAVDYESRSAYFLNVIYKPHHSYMYMYIEISYNYLQQTSETIIVAESNAMFIYQYKHYNTSCGKNIFSVLNKD